MSAASAAASLCGSPTKQVLSGSDNYEVLYNHATLLLGSGEHQKALTVLHESLKLGQKALEGFEESNVNRSLSQIRYQIVYCKYILGQQYLPELRSIESDDKLLNSLIYTMLAVEEPKRSCGKRSLINSITQLVPKYGTFQKQQMLLNLAVLQLLDGSPSGALEVLKGHRFSEQLTNHVHRIKAASLATRSKARSLAHLKMTDPSGKANLCQKALNLVASNKPAKAAALLVRAGICDDLLAAIYAMIGSTEKVTNVSPLQSAKIEIYRDLRADIEQLQLLPSSAECDRLVFIVEALSGKLQFPSRAAKLKKTLLKRGQRPKSESSRKTKDGPNANALDPERWLPLKQRSCYKASTTKKLNKQPRSARAQ